jgi:hypothetical protein
MGFREINHLKMKKNNNNNLNGSFEINHEFKAFYKMM